MSKPVTVLFLGSLTHSEEYNFLDKTKPHEDEIHFQDATRVSLIRIPRPGKDIYSRHISITQSQTIKNFEIYYRNLQKTTGKFSLLTSNNQLLASSTDDILITPKQPIYTDLLLIKGNFTKITLCIYGNVIKDETLIQEKCPNYRVNAPIDSLNQGLIKIEKDIFEEKRNVIREIERELEMQKDIEEWHTIVNDDGINEQQIDNICKLSQKLLSSFNSQNLLQQSFIVSLRTGLQQISTNLAKIFKNKHLGLYYPSYEDSNISNELPVSVTRLALESLELSFSEQFRALQILRFTLQLDKHSQFFIENKGIEKLIQLFVQFFRSGSVILSTYKNILLQVLISISQWKNGAFVMTQKIQNPFYHQLFQNELKIIKQKQEEQRQRSRQKKTKKSRSNSSDSSDDEPKKKKKDKKKNKDKDKEKKKGKQSKTKEEALKKKSQQIEEQKKLSIIEKVPVLSFYEILLFQLANEKNIKHLIMIKILLEQIVQTMCKDNISSQRVALSTSLLKDTKYIFNPAGEVLNTKSLKQFASYQPFLNSVQSRGVNNDMISQREKLRNIQKYEISPKVCKILTKINIQLASNEFKQYQSEVKSAFDSSFIVMMSELIRQRSQSLLYGFGRILDSFKIESSNDIIYLKKIEAAMTMISQYIYKILIEDNGLYTVLNIDQIYASLINITNCLSKDPSAFTKQLKRNIKKLTNYAMVYDLFNRSEGNFKVISDYFLKLFKFDHFQINKISDYKKKQYDRMNKQFLLSNLNESINLGNFQQLFPQQPLLEIDVYLKIFNILLQYNKNVWTLFYENKLLCGFSVLYGKLSNMVIFLLTPSYQRQSIIVNMKKLQISVDNYLTVLDRLLNLLAKKSQYEAAFNDLLDEDNFEHVQVYAQSLELYITLFNANHQNSALLSSKSKKLTDKILSKIIRIFDKLIQSYELTSHVSRQIKLKQMWHSIYVTHYTNISSRAACLSLISFFIQTLENTSIKLFNTYCIDESIKMDSYTSHKIPGYLPQNDKNMIENFILSNIFRRDPYIQQNLCLLIRNLLQKHSDKNPMCEKITPYLEHIFDDVQTKFRFSSGIQTKMDLIPLQKMQMLTQILKNLNNILTIKFEQKLIKFLKNIDNFIKLENEILLSDNQLLISVHFYVAKIKTNIITFLKKSFIEKRQHPQILQFVQLLNKNLQIGLTARYELIIDESNYENFRSMNTNLLIQYLKLTNSSLSVLCALSSNCYNQSVMLYEVFLQKPYKPVPQVNFNNLFNRLTTVEMINYYNKSFEGKQKLNQIKQSLKSILVKIVYFLCQLTTIQSKQFYSTESRRNAIICLVTEDKQFPFDKLDALSFVIPQLFIRNLKDYFAYPIIEKPLIMKEEVKKQYTKSKGYIFSKSVFSIIMQGQQVAKNRYQYIGGPWKSGDLNSKSLYSPARQRNYNQIVKKCLSSYNFIQDIDIYLKQSYHCSKSQYEPNQIYELNAKKRTKAIEKKPVECVIKLLNIPLVLQVPSISNPYMRTQVNPVMKKQSPSPSNRYPGQNYPKGSSQQRDQSIRKSTSPPTNRIPTQGLIGFGSPSQNNYGNNNNMQQNINNSASKNNQPQTPQFGPKVNYPPSNMMPINMNINVKPLQPVNMPPMNPNIPQMNPNIPQTMNPNIPQAINQNIPPSDMSQMRSGSDSANRNLPPNYSRNYPPQYPGQNYYNQPNNANYPNVPPPSSQPTNYPLNQVYDNRSQSPYQKTYPISTGYGNRGGYNQQNNYYPNQQNYMNQPGYNPNYISQPRGPMLPQNRPYSPSSSSSSYNPSPYPNSIPSSLYNYPPTTSNYYPTQSNYNNNNLQQQRQFNDAILLVTELRGTLPENMKNQKKNRLNVLLTNPRIQARVRGYISSLK